MVGSMEVIGVVVAYWWTKNNVYYVLRLKIKFANGWTISINSECTVSNPRPYKFSGKNIYGFKILLVKNFPAKELNLSAGFARKKMALQAIRFWSEILNYWLWFSYPNANCFAQLTKFFGVCNFFPSFDFIAIARLIKPWRGGWNIPKLNACKYNPQEEIWQFTTRPTGRGGRISVGRTLIACNEWSVEHKQGNESIKLRSKVGNVDRLE